MKTVFDFNLMEIVDMKPLPSMIELSASEFSETVEATTPKSSNEINLADLWCNKKSILIVDGDPMNRESLKIVINSVVGKSYIIETANGDSEAIKLME